MKTHRQSTDTTWTSRGGALDFRGAGGSRSCAPIQAMPPRKRMTSAGIDQTIISIRPEYSHSGRYRARELPDRNHQAKQNVSRMTGTPTASMMAVASSNISLSALPTGPRGSRGPSLHEASVRHTSAQVQAWRDSRPSLIGVMMRSFLRSAVAPIPLMGDSRCCPRSVRPRCPDSASQLNDPPAQAEGDRVGAIASTQLRNDVFDVG